MRYCENKNLYLVMGCDSNAHLLHATTPTVMIDGRPWWNFLILRIWTFLIRANSPPFVVVIGSR